MPDIVSTLTSVLLHHIGLAPLPVSIVPCFLLTSHAQYLVSHFLSLHSVPTSHFLIGSLTPRLIVICLVNLPQSTPLGLPSRDVF